jgi:hypothetical protein
MYNQNSTSTGKLYNSAKSLRSGTQYNKKIHSEKFILANCMMQGYATLVQKEMEHVRK